MRTLSLPLIALFLVTLAPRSARADMVGGDIPLLTGILSTLASQLTTVNQTLDTAKKAYQMSQQLAGYAADGVQAYNQFKSLNGKLFAQNVEDALTSAYPDLGYFQGQLSNRAQWDQGTGALQQQLTVCFSDALTSSTGVTVVGMKCAALRQGLMVDQVASALKTTFGDVAPVVGSAETQVSDNEAAKAVAAAHNTEQKSQAIRTQSAVLLQQCQSGNAAACTAAGNTAGIEGLALETEVSDQLSEANRLAAMRVAQESARRKREINETVEQHLLISDTATAELTAAATPTVEGDGYNLIDGVAF